MTKCKILLVEDNRKLPVESGIDLCREIRTSSDVPILFLTACDATEDIVTALRAGGDDYVTKPFNFNVLIARIEALLRRTGQVIGIRENEGADSAFYRVLRDFDKGERFRMTWTVKKRQVRRALFCAAVAFCLLCAGALPGAADIRTLGDGLITIATGAGDVKITGTYTGIHTGTLAVVEVQDKYTGTITLDGVTIDLKWKELTNPHPARGRCFAGHRAGGNQHADGRTGLRGPWRA